MVNFSAKWLGSAFYVRWFGGCSWWRCKKRSKYPFHICTHLQNLIDRYTQSRCRVPHITQIPKTERVKILTNNAGFSTLKIANNNLQNRK
jgi:hypothetical protein